MTDRSNLEFVGRMRSEKLASAAGDCKKERAEILADQELWAKYGTNNPRKVTLSKREIMEEMSRERFPWEE